MNDDIQDDIRERLSQMKEALEHTNGRDKPSRIVYCTECDDYAVGHDPLACDPLNDESDEDHLEHHFVGDYEETSILGYISALEWIVDIIEDDPEVVRDLKEQQWVCTTHGELDVDDLVVSVGGSVMCNYCSINQEVQPHLNIDPRVEMRL